VPRVLHLLSQRPSLTGSGVTLEALVSHAAAAGWQQRVVVGVPAGEPTPEVGGLAAGLIHPLVFGTGGLDFPVPGMSDVMPYPSTVFATMSGSQVESYLAAWRRHLEAVLGVFRPDVVHSHHVWLASSLVKDLAPSPPLVIHCHATGLRQMELAPGLAARVREGCRRADAFVVLHGGHAAELAAVLEVPADRIRVVGAGYRDDLFHRRGRQPDSSPTLLYVGKYSAAKGLPQLLEVVDRLASTHPGVVLHVAGEGSGTEAEALRSRMRAAAPRVVLHGQLAQPGLADLMRRCSVCVLPSFYEGLPLVLVEALACGCRLVATDVPGVVSELAPRLGDALEVVRRPVMAGIDTPDAAELPVFVDRLEAAIVRALAAPPLGGVEAAIAPFTWDAVFGRVEGVWREVIGG
jgi:glycosyltransferase involved in cell wall biosynthesis